MPKRKTVINPVDIHAGHRLKAARTMKGISQGTLADELGLTFQQVQKYETGSNRISASRMWKMCEIFGVTPNYFFEGLTNGASSLPKGDLGLSAEELKVVSDLRRMSTPLRDAFVILVDQAAHQDRKVRTTDRPVAVGAASSLQHLIRPFGRNPNKPNYLTSQEATNLYEYFRDVVWEGQYDFVGSPWAQQPDGSWHRVKGNQTLVVKPDGCLVVTLMGVVGEQEVAHG